MERRYLVYIMSSPSRTLSIGVTNDLERRVWQHRHHPDPHSFTTRYGVTSLVHVESYPDPHSAIAREKQLKGWRRAKKIALIETANPGWCDLSEAWDDG